ncbi:MAG TPA: alpha/beta hydrolase [Chloroflexota bacterium]
MFEGFELTTIDTREARIRVRHGGSGPPLLLLHGNPQTHVMWHKIAPRLARDFTVVAADLRGYGDSSKPPNSQDHAAHSKRAMARDQVEVMRQLGFEQFFLAGHDRGARCAYRLALDHPERVRKLAVLDIIPTYETYRRADMQFGLRTWHWFFLAQPADFPERAITRAPEVFFERRPATYWTDEARADYWRCYQNPETIRAICEDYRAGASIDFQLDKADVGTRKISCPLLVLWGTKSWFGMGWDFLAIWHEWADDVRGRGIESGHFLAEEVPDETYAELREFFSS